MKKKILLAALALVAVAAVILLIALPKPLNYKKAEQLYAAGEYQAAADQFKALADYKDAATRVKDCDYALASETLEKGDLDAALTAFDALGDFSDAAAQARQIRLQQLKDAKVGTCASWGSYEQDGNKENGNEPIQWIVLAEDDGKKLLLSRDVLLFWPFSSKKDVVKWARTDVRSKLDEFESTAFTAEEAAIIAETSVTTKDNTTTETVYLLSTEELRQYLRDNMSLWEAKPTAAISNSGSDTGYWARCDVGMDVQSVFRSIFEGGNQEEYEADYVHGTFVSEHNVTDPEGVRPAMWVNLAD